MKKIKKICLTCGKEFESWPSQNRYYCSRKCGYKSPKRQMGHRIPLLKKRCLNCGKIFLSERWKHQKFCSLQCGINYHKGITLIKIKCLQCGKIFEREPWQHQKFCSVKCGIDYHRGKPRKPRLKSKTKRIRNYREIRTIDGRRVALHRYLVEQKIGRKLKSSETVHHKDMDINNNPQDCSNYYLYPNESAHIKGHRSLEKLVPSLIEGEIIGFENGRYYIL